MTSLFLSLGISSLTPNRRLCSLPLSLQITSEAVMERIKAAQQEFMEGDTPPTMSATANQVAIGIYSSDTSFRYVEVYAESYVELSEENPSTIVGSEVTVSGTGEAKPGAKAASVANCLMVLQATS